jgi:hypothetical protein
MSRRVAGAFLAAHGVAHTLAFAIAWRLTESPDLPYTTELFGGRLDVGSVGIRLVGVLWLVAGAALVFAGLRVWRRHPLAPATLAAAAGLSLLLCLTQPGRAQVGLAIDVALLLVLAARWLLARRAERRPPQRAATA